MTQKRQLQELISKWTAVGDGYRAEALRLERSDRCRHATSIVMLEAHAQAVDRCMLELRAVAGLRTTLGLRGSSATLLPERRTVAE